jgi:hypothetical protein
MKNTCTPTCAEGQLRPPSSSHGVDVQLGRLDLHACDGRLKHVLQIPSVTRHVWGGRSDSTGHNLIARRWSASKREQIDGTHQ